MSDNPDLERVCAKAAERGYEVRQLSKRVFTVCGGRSKLLSRIMPLQIGTLHAFGTLEEIDVWLDRDRQ